MTSFEGSCLCGAVKFIALGPTKWCSHCHCSMCQRAHGAAFVTWFGIEQEQFRLLVDTELRWYESSSEAERGFCGSCGSSLFFRSLRWPGEIHIARANVAGEIDREPSVHVSWDSHVPWVALDDALTRKE